MKPSASGAFEPGPKTKMSTVATVACTKGGAMGSSKK